MSPLLSVSNLHIDFDQARPAVNNISIDLYPGETLALVGESGSGKSMTARAILGLLPPGSSVSGSVLFDGQELLGLSDHDLEAIRGRRISLVFQEPQSALNPVRRVGWQLEQALRAHDRSVTGHAAKARALELLELVEIPEPARRIRYYPHQLSGGQKQRVAIALALANDPEILIADEPTTALDATVQKEILTLLAKISARDNTAVLLITHNMGVVARYSDRVVVLRHGDVVESATTEQLFTAPREEYTRELLDAVPVLNGRFTTPPAPTSRTSTEAPVLEFRETSVVYPAKAGSPAFRAVDEVSFAVRPREIVGLVGESGSGKTTLGKVATGLISPTGGSVLVDGQDLASLPAAELRRQRSVMAFVPQDPAASLNPRFSVGAAIREPLDVHGIGTRTSRTLRVRELLDAVRLPQDIERRYPAELSGGQRQRIALARALALSPRLIIADEPTSALDVSVQAQVIDLFRELQQELGFASVFITHDLSVVSELCHRVVVLNRGAIEEEGRTSTVFTSPRSNYTSALLQAIPRVDGEWGKETSGSRSLAPEPVHTRS